jgi:hypothetical protein
LKHGPPRRRAGVKRLPVIQIKAKRLEFAQEADEVLQAAAQAVH